MGTEERRKRERQQRKEDILAAAKELFMTKGLSRTTMEDIANRAELSQGTLYLYFKNKEDLYASLNLKLLQYIYEQGEKVLRNNRLRADEKLFKMKNVFFQAYVSEPVILHNIIRLQVESGLSFLSPKVLSRINTLTKTVMTMIAQTYEAGVDEGVFRNEKGIVVADTMWALFTGLVLYEETKRKLDPHKDFLKSTLDSAFTLFFHGLTNITASDGFRRTSRLYKNK